MPINFLTHHVVNHSTDELSMRHKYFFDYQGECDGISATANMDGFTVLNAIKMHFGWDTDFIRQASTACNERDEIAVLSELSPKLFLVPRTRADDPVKSRFYMTDLFAAADKVSTQTLQFTHYSFTDHLGFKEEYKSVLNAIYSESTLTKLNHLVLDLDARIFRKTLRFIRKNEIRRHRALSLLFLGDKNLLNFKV